MLPPRPPAGSHTHEVHSAASGTCGPRATTARPHREPVSHASSSSSSSAAAAAVAVAAVRAPPVSFLSSVTSAFRGPSIVGPSIWPSSFVASSSSSTNAPFTTTSLPFSARSSHPIIRPPSSSPSVLQSCGIVSSSSGIGVTTPRPNNPPIAIASVLSTSSGLRPAAAVSSSSSSSSKVAKLERRDPKSVKGGGSNKGLSVLQSPAKLSGPPYLKDGFPLHPLSWFVQKVLTDSTFCTSDNIIKEAVAIGGSTSSTSPSQGSWTSPESSVAKDPFRSAFFDDRGPRTASSADGTSENWRPNERGGPTSTMTTSPKNPNRAIMRSLTRLADSLVREVLSTCMRCAKTKREPSAEKDVQAKRRKKEDSTTSMIHTGSRSGGKKKIVTGDSVVDTLDMVWGAYALMKGVGGTALPTTTTTTTTTMTTTTTTTSFGRYVGPTITSSTVGSPSGALSGEDMDDDSPQESAMRMMVCGKQAEIILKQEVPMNVEEIEGSKCREPLNKKAADKFQLIRGRGHYRESLAMQELYDSISKDPNLLRRTSQ